MQFDYARTFGKHEVTGLGLFSRLKEAQEVCSPFIGKTGYSVLPITTPCAISSRPMVFIMVPKKFGPDYRFAFFPLPLTGLDDQ